jgi:hypothetical protein
MTKEAKRLGNQPAFPTLCFYQNREADETCTFEVRTDYGLTKREYFAGLAMQGYCSDPNVSNFDNTARDAVKQADALLEELVKK